MELSLWTDRMLTALDVSVKGGVWFSMIDNVAIINAGPTRTVRRWDSLA